MGFKGCAQFLASPPSRCAMGEIPKNPCWVEEDEQMSRPIRKIKPDKVKRDQFKNRKTSHYCESSACTPNEKLRIEGVWVYLYVDGRKSCLQSLYRLPGFGCRGVPEDDASLWYLQGDDTRDVG